MIQIIHTPFGQEHPYEQLPEERFPRQPLADQPFTIGIVTRPPGAVQQVTVQIWLDGVQQNSISAKPLRDWQPELEAGVGAELIERIVHVDQDVWQAALTAPAFGQTLIYRIDADGQ